MLKRIVTSVALAFAVLLLVGAAYFAYASPYKLYVIHTGSMGQTIPPRSAVVVHQGVYHVGQVISFTTHGETVTHRLLRIRSDRTIVTKGDANASADPSYVPVTNIIGEVVLAPREVGWWFIFLGQPANIVALLLLMFGVRFLWKLDETAPKAPEMT